MPIFDYACRNCETVSEILLKSSDPSPKCEDCGNTLYRVLSYPSMFMLKGDGWTGSNYVRK